MNFHDNDVPRIDTDVDGGQNEEFHSSFYTEEREVGYDAQNGVGGFDFGGGESTTSPLHDVAMEGYTPLNFNMNEFVMLQDGSDDLSDDGGNIAIVHEEMDGELFSSGYYHVMGAAPRRMNGVKDSVSGYAVPHLDDDHDDDSSQTDISDSGVENPEYNLESSLVPDDFHLLAENVLRGLEVEHSSTLEMATNTMVRNETFSISCTQMNSGHEFCEGAEMIQTADDLLSNTSESAIHTSTAAAVAAATEIMPTKESKLSRAKPVDVNAIQKAMQSIRLKSPKLASTLDAGALSSFSTTAADVAIDAALASSRIMEQSHDARFQTHPIIPAVPLAAFRRVTLKAQAASANLTRSATLSDAVLRLWPLICFRRKMIGTGIGVLSQQETSSPSKTLTIHIVGVDGVECSSESSVHKSVSPFVRWLNAALYSGILREYNGTGMAAQSQVTEIEALLIEFFGPNLPRDMVGNILDLLPPSLTPSSRLTSAKATFHQREYHEGSICADCADTQLADLAIAFNAGIWGYDSWKPTIERMIRGSNVDSPCDKKSMRGSTIFVITAYTLEESEDDASVILDLVETIALNRSMKLQENNAQAIARQLWAPEPNPFSSRIERYTASAPPGRKYFENGAWQAWLLGV